MGQVFVLLLVLASSFAAYVWTRPERQAGPSALRSAIQTMLECMGAATVFLAVNTTLGTGLILAIRSIAPFFVSVYVLNPFLLLVFSLIQGFVFQLWWRGTRTL